MRRVRATFASLTVIAVAATGVLTRAAGWPPGPRTALTVAMSGAVAAAALALAERILVVVGRGH